MFYAQRLSFLLWIKEWGGPWLACILTFGLLWMSHAPRQTPEAAYIFLLPVLIWFHFRPGCRKGSYLHTPERVGLSNRHGRLDEACLIRWYVHRHLSALLLSGNLVYGGPYAALLVF